MHILDVLFCNVLYSIHHPHVWGYLLVYCTLQYTNIYIPYMWMVYSLVVRVCGLKFGGREFESRSLHLKPETKLREERE